MVERAGAANLTRVAVTGGAHRRLAASSNRGAPLGVPRTLQRRAAKHSHVRHRLICGANQPSSAPPVYVIVDTNVLVADPWLEGHGMRALFDFITRTQGDLLIYDVVRTEAAAIFRRRVREATADLAAARDAAARVTREELPPVDPAALVDAAVARWEAETRSRLRDVARFVPLNPAILAETVRRAAERVRPSTEGDKQFRDTVLWLSMLDHLPGYIGGYPAAFISANPRDFAAGSSGDARVQLHPDLRAEADAANLTLEFYTSLQAFLKAHAEPIAHITPEWVAERLSETEVETFILEYLEAHEADWHPTSWAGRWFGLRTDGRVVGGPRAKGVSVSVDEAFVWTYGPAEYELFLTLLARVHGEVEVEEELEDWSAGSADEWGTPRGRRTVTREMEFDYDLGFLVTARVDRDRVVPVAVDKMWDRD